MSALHTHNYTHKSWLDAEENSGGGEPDLSYHSRCASPTRSPKLEPVATGTLHSARVSAQKAVYGQAQEASGGMEPTTSQRASTL